ETVLYDFCSAANCADGQAPVAGVIIDGAGKLYGTTEGGGENGQGVVFGLSLAGTGWTETVLHSFCTQTNCLDGQLPFAGVIIDGAGNLYGTTFVGGENGSGVVFRLSPAGT